MVRREAARIENAKEKELREGIDDPWSISNRSNFHRKYASLVSRRICEEEAPAFSIMRTQPTPTIYTHSLTLRVSELRVTGTD